MTHRCTLHVTVADLGELPAVVEAIEALGHAVECPAHDARERLRRRNEYLRRGGALMGASSTWGKSVELAREVGTFESIVWPRWCDFPSPPQGCSELRRYLFEARRLDELPSSERRLYSILKREDAGHFSGERD